jgi:hypothetical protein
METRTTTQKTEVTQAKPLPSVMDNLRDGIMKFITPVTVNTPSQEDPKLEYPEIADLVMKYQNTALQGGDIFGVTGDLEIDNISARDGIFEPMLMERLFEVHAPYKLEVQPRIFSFDSDGNATFGANVATSVVLASVASATPGLVGWAFRIKAVSTLSGDASVTIAKSATNFSATVSLREINTAGTAVVMNHDIDDLKTVSVAVGNFAAAVQTLNYTEVITDINNQLFFSYSETSNWTITGTNAKIFVYPIVVSRLVNATIYACIFNEEMNRLPVLLAEMYK